MTGKEIKNYAKSKGVLLWKVAKKYGVADTTFSQYLRLGFNDTESLIIKSIIDELSAGRQSDDE